MAFPKMSYQIHSARPTLDQRRSRAAFKSIWTNVPNHIFNIVPSFYKKNYNYVLTQILRFLFLFLKYFVEFSYAYIQLLKYIITSFFKKKYLLKPFYLYIFLQR